MGRRFHEPAAFFVCRSNQFKTATRNTAFWHIYPERLVQTLPPRTQQVQQSTQSYLQQWGIAAVMWRRWRSEQFATATPSRGEHVGSMLRNTMPSAQATQKLAIPRQPIACRTTSPRKKEPRRGRGSAHKSLLPCPGGAKSHQAKLVKAYLKAFSKLGTTCFLRLMTPGSHTDSPSAFTPKAFSTTEGSSETISISEPSFMMSVSSRNTL